MYLVLLFFVNIELLINTLFNEKIRNSMIYKVMKFVCIFKIMNEFMIIIIDDFSILILCKYSVTNKLLVFLWEN